ncbi:HNH endonuclease [Arthrobacter sp. SPG23]|uniref:HNH endonuclease signature motif containing protein n=1 Tax=Arthrobacter sp. SPG23 TaxID=1610703 RepID=UPI0005B949DF|nr:HNH endonuclease signature motif containing protein [Arthrobacter sp. SPG23]KIS26209.1 HNH endonuclease [Arthrobacter sp. SPG23]
MEAVGELAPNQALRLGRFSNAPFEPETPKRTLRAVPPDSVVADGGGAGDLAWSLELLKRAASTAVANAAVMRFREAADFAAKVEEISRTLEYLQVVAAGEVDRARREASDAARAGSGSGAAVGWTTGWGDATAVHGPIGWATGAPHQADSGMGESDRADGGPGGSDRGTEATVPGTNSEVINAGEPDPADDGCRNTTEFLRARLRIGAAEARRRLALAEAVLPRTGITGHAEPPERPVLAAAVASGSVGSRSATLITLALDRVRHHAPEETMARVEHTLTRTAAENDTDFVARIARQLVDAIDQDGTEPSEEELRHRQGAFIRKPRRGLYHVEIFATQDQYEPLLTVMNTAANPRTRAGAAEGNDGTVNSGDLDLRTRPQQLLDGLVGAAKVALASGNLPAAGGLRPQVMVTIDYRDILERLDRLDHSSDAAGGTPGTGTPGTPGTGARGIPGIPGTGSFTFTGPVTASTVRKISCDADIIPVLLGSEGRILDIGRTTRIFPPHIRKAITARDQGCAFPNCTIPAPWCEAHHISYWSHGGTTSTENGTLLCSHHHHLIHKEQWQIQVKTGIPWFIPPPHIDPQQKPQRNNYFRLE